jgi:hypothetical protein
MAARLTKRRFTGTTRRSDSWDASDALLQGFADGE